MRKLLVVASLALLGCTGPHDVIVSATAASSVHVRESVPITLTVYNGSREPVQVSGFGCLRNFEVFSASRNLVSQAGPIACFVLDIGPPLIIAAGQSATLSALWSGKSDDNTYVQPGLYSIRPRLYIDGQIVHGADIHITVSQ